ncbi:MAG TPA: GNAT family N-acetyltransferase [Chthoniobacterales bacterium]|nr:GNAT family N-acetyltransferase [Chthoniobacterales bacterium]
MKQEEPPKVSTREFRIDDFSAVVSIWETAEGVEVAEGDSKGEVQEYLLRNPGLSRVALNGETIVGAVLCGHDGRRGLIYHLAVAPAHHGKGIGRRLLQECVDGLHSVGITRALILVSEENAKGRAFWLRNGWEDVPGAIVMGLDI